MDSILLSNMGLLTVIGVPEGQVKIEAWCPNLFLIFPKTITIEDHISDFYY